LVTHWENATGNSQTGRMAPAHVSCDVTLYTVFH